MLTRQGIVAAVAGVAALVIGRMFGVIELFVIGAGFLAAVVVALVFVSLRAPSVTGTRWIHPKVLVAGDVGRVDLQLTHHGVVRSTRFTLHERIGRTHAPENAARLGVEPMAARSQAGAGYRLPTSTRGLVHLGPLTSEVRDPLGIARRFRPVAGTDTVTVAPRAHLLDIPTLGSGPLGRQLMATARRLGPGEFHSLREYADGDEPRSIHWRASARSETLLVKEYAVEGLRRVLIVFDADLASYADAASFERGVTAAASLAKSAGAAGLTTRFVTNGGNDLRGPDVAEHALALLAEIQPTSAPFGQLDRDPGEGVGLLVVVTGTTRSAGWRAASSVVDPTLTVVPITTDEAPRGPVGAAARTEAELVSSWRAITGRGSGVAAHRKRHETTGAVPGEQFTAPTSSGAP
ncbi:DUF58 domain-containing protein [Ilumatobacter coccineus]|uniref:DUF58 domain-containing protein n=1 Tax=Ilumatobacter coccineus (strain NBRC 103263 / KCTC 29153 / YM16-304) TaxID=1313172 RepID=A0A6C7EE54_ILUCY|nr:DUF58 domain-containing protein [Ilumatobacter coccineus]BAN02246.1 hypothetical protein YM304_19320 [Ilumatobacter coccineus YM16-304]